MTEVTSNRGTSKIEVDDESGKNWAGKKFKKFQKETLEKAGDTKVSTNRGTYTTDANDIPETEQVEAKKVTSKRGTSTEEVST